jgi:hypothetical protein
MLMARLADCNACSMGDHKNHVRVVVGVPKGMMGGVICDCNGDCVERNKDWFMRDPAAQMLHEAMIRSQQPRR